MPSCHGCPKVLIKCNIKIKFIKKHMTASFQVTYIGKRVINQKLRPPPAHWKLIKIYNWIKPTYLVPSSSGLLRYSDFSSMGNFFNRWIFDRFFPRIRFNIYVYRLKSSCSVLFFFKFLRNPQWWNGERALTRGLGRY